MLNCCRLNHTVYNISWWMFYSKSAIHKLRSALNALKTLFGFRRHSVTEMFLELGIVSFDTLLVNSRVNYSSIVHGVIAVIKLPVICMIYLCRDLICLDILLFYHYYLCDFDLHFNVFTMLRFSRVSSRLGYEGLCVSVCLHMTSICLFYLFVSVYMGLVA